MCGNGIVKCGFYFFWWMCCLEVDVQQSDIYVVWVNCFFQFMLGIVMDYGMIFGQNVIYGVFVDYVVQCVVGGLMQIVVCVGYVKQIVFWIGDVVLYVYFNVYYVFVRGQYDVGSCKFVY